MNNTQYYALKYNLKYAMTDPNFSEAEKKQIRQAEQVSKLIVYGYYLYAVIDTVWTVMSNKRLYGHNYHLYKKIMVKNSFFISARLFLLYELSEYASMLYLVKQTEHLIRKKHPLKEELISKMSEF